MRHSIRAAVLTAAALVVTPGLGRAQTYDVRADYSASNPSGVWAYGFKPNLNGAFTPFTSTGLTAGTILYHSSNPTGDLTPGVFKNVGPAPLLVPGAIDYQPGEAAFHPGINGTLAVYRFTAPAAGTYALTSRFYGLDADGPTNTNIFIELPNSALTFGVGNVAGYRAASEITFDQLLVLSAGDVVDFEVDFNGSYFHDSTAIDAQLAVVTATPEPASAALLGGGVLALGLVARRRR